MAMASRLECGYDNMFLYLVAKSGGAATAGGLSERIELSQLLPRQTRRGGRSRLDRRRLALPGGHSAAARILCRRTQDLFADAKPAGHGFSKSRVVRVAENTLRRNNLLQATGRAHKQTEGGSRRGCGEWGEPHSHHHSLPPGDRP